MDVAILTFEGFNELDSFIALGILNRVKSAWWNVQITCPSDQVTSMNGVTVKAQQALELANAAEVVVFGSGIYTRDIAENASLLGRLELNSAQQIICAQCSNGRWIMSINSQNRLFIKNLTKASVAKTHNRAAADSTKLL